MVRFPNINKLSKASQLSLLAIFILMGAIFFTVNTALEQQSGASHASGTGCQTILGYTYCPNQPYPSGYSFGYPTPTPYSGQNCKQVWTGWTYTMQCITPTPTPKPIIPTTGPTTAPTSATVPLAPTGLTATPGNQKVTLNWDAMPGDYFWIYERNVSLGQTTFTKLTYPDTTNVFTYTPAQNGQKFAFKVSAIGPNSVEGPKSVEVSAIPSATAPIPTATSIPVLTSTPAPTCAPPPTCYRGGALICLMPYGGWCGFNPTPAPTEIPSVGPTTPPVPTETPAPGSTVLHFAISLHGIGNGGDSANPNSGGNTNPLRPGRTIAVNIYDVQNQLVTTQQGNVQFDQNSGKFTGTVNLGSQFATGLYTVKVKTDQYLRAIVPGIQTITAGQATTLPQVTLIAGDINGDNAINIIDYNILIGCYSDLLPPTSCTASNNVLSDITDDGHVNQFDYNLFLRELTNIGGQ